MADDAARRPAPDVLRIRPTVGSIVLIIAAAGGATVLIDLFGATRRVLAWTLATVVVAWLAWAIIALFDRWLPRGLAVMTTVLILVILGGGIWVAVAATVRSEVSRIRTSLPEAAESLEQRYEAAAHFRLAERVQSFVDDLDERFSTTRTVSKVAETAPTYFVTGILMLFLVGYGARYCAAGLRQIADPARRDRVAAVVGRASGRARVYLLVTVAQVLITTLVSAGAFFMLDARAPFLLGLVVGVLGAVPYVGFVLGGVVPVLVAAADRDELAVIAVIVIVVGLQLIEAYVVRPRLDRRTLRVGPALMLIVGMICFELYGLGGAVYGCAVLVFALAVLDSVAAYPMSSDPALPG
ncbi:MAG: AI-2E family transporter [Actinomycetota bacterium]|nr:AI-2E family transporter [Actinomycetota bacterium]